MPGRVKVCHGLEREEAAAEEAATVPSFVSFSSRFTLTFNNHDDDVGVVDDEHSGGGIVRFPD